MKRKLIGLLIVAFGIVVGVGSGVEAQADTWESSSSDGSVYEKTGMGWNASIRDSIGPFYQISHASNLHEIPGNCQVDQCDKRHQVDAVIIQSTMTEKPDAPYRGFNSLVVEDSYISFYAYGIHFGSFASSVETVKETHTIKSKTYYYKHYFKGTFTTDINKADMCKTEYLKRYPVPAPVSNGMWVLAWSEDLWYSMRTNPMF